jgi:hypothetical protein
MLSQISSSKLKSQQSQLRSLNHLKISSMINKMQKLKLLNKYSKLLLKLNMKMK